MEGGVNNIQDTTNGRNVPVVEPEVIKWKPTYKMEFDSEEEANDFYNAYGGRIGFSIRKEYGNKVNGRITSRALVCSKEGVKGIDKRDVFRKTPRAETRTNCGAQMVLRYDKPKAKYIVSKFVKSHNHPFIIAECSHMMPSQQRISSVQAIDI
ncbi:protein FAR1-RELATED SEQUENCE 5-like [Cornus florida]|uniref:protein FAR1-RELATED SEQUENCE 5-like n=1 Tax=Cornus florida TaxID=4283 RepID=UPI002898682A|nr:protein FAR1-RELATED SEQUENCE 5-like [Cornus florida]